MVIAIGADGDGVLHWCSIGAITSITIVFGANGLPLAPFFVAIRAIGENPQSSRQFYQIFHVMQNSSFVTHF